MTRKPTLSQATPYNAPLLLVVVSVGIASILIMAGVGWVVWHALDALKGVL